jgi:hypothetical protein
MEHMPISGEEIVKGLGNRDRYSREEILWVMGYGVWIWSIGVVGMGGGLSGEVDGEGNGDWNVEGNGEDTSVRVRMM